jgi:transcriptional regulator with PAS, ATPase and Fis domain
MLALFRSILQVAAACSGVLIESESGTGKELVARAIHKHSARRDRPFIPINCAAINDSLIESELFGHISGAFSGATSGKPGLVNLADHGVLFLDEVSEMSLLMQAKILRLAEEGEYRSVGETTTRHVDVRLVAASNKNLAELVAQGKFRQDLYYRLKVILLRIPPLRERLDDLPLLAEVFLTRAAARHSMPVPRMDPGALDALLRHSWPGNVRELKNCLEAMVVTCSEGEISSRDVSQYLGALPPTYTPPAARLDLVDFERLRQLQEAIRAYGGKKSAIAKALGIARSTLDRRLRRYGLTRHRPSDRSAL